MRRTLLIAVAFFLLAPAISSASTLNATPSTLAAQVSAAQAGDTIQLAAGSYGTWAGTSKAITLKAADGATATMKVNFTTGDSGFTLDGLSGMGGSITNGAKNITIRNSRFIDHLVIDGVANANILLDHNTHTGINSCSSCDPAMVHLAYGSSTPSGVTISNSLFADGNADGVQTGVGVNIIGNEFRNIKEGSCSACHTDPIQLIDAPGSVVRGNWLHNVSDGIVAYDGLDHAVIENNVLDLVNGRWGIELYSDNGSIIRHNTLVYGTGCSYAPCGYIMLDRKSTDPAGTGTVIVDNIATAITTDNGSTAARQDHNLVRSDVSTGDSTGTPAYVSAGTSYAGFKLAAGSPGVGTASDGLDRGITIDGPVPPADVTPPDTAIQNGPTDSTSTSATVAFTSTEAGSTFQCQLDSGAWASCTTPKSYGSLAVGQHTISVRATDLAGNVDLSPASVTWTVLDPAPSPDPCAQTAAERDQALEDLAAMTASRDSVQALADAYKARAETAEADLAAMTTSRDAWKARAEKAEDQVSRIKAITGE